MTIIYREPGVGANITSEIDLSYVRIEFAIGKGEMQEMRLDEFIYSMLERITELERRCNAEDFGWGDE